MIQEVLYRLQLKETEEHKPSYSEIYVTSLVQCPLKFTYSLKFPEIATAQNYQPYLILGKLVHYGLQHLLMELSRSDFLKEFKLVGVEVECSKTISVDASNLPYIVHVKGRADLIVEKDGEKIVVEIKTAKGDYNIPSEHHVLQLRIYMNMLGIGKGLLLYITPERIAEIPVEKPLDDFELSNLVKEFLQRKGPRYSWECSYCQYAILCPFKKTNSRR